MFSKEWPEPFEQEPFYDSEGNYHTAEGYIVEAMKIPPITKADRFVIQDQHEE